MTSRTFEFARECRGKVARVIRGLRTQFNKLLVCRMSFLGCPWTNAHPFQTGRLDSASERAMGLYRRCVYDIPATCLVVGGGMVRWFKGSPVFRSKYQVRYIVTYALGIYLLNLLIGFLSPLTVSLLSYPVCISRLYSLRIRPKTALRCLQAAAMSTNHLSAS